MPETTSEMYETAERLEDLFRENPGDERGGKDEDRPEAADSLLSAASPNIDFLTGSQIALNDEALRAAQEEVERRLKDKYPGYKVRWSGTKADVLDPDGEKADETEIHGAVWNRKSKQVRGVRFDLSALRDYEKRKREEGEAEE